ncbi:MAG: hypothetical protein R2708_13655 [Vicinamibacterales bacterium]
MSTGARDRATIPFFTWALEDPDFVAGRFDTGFIDRKLVERAGRPFDAPSAAEETAALLAAALHLALRAAASLLEITGGPGAPEAGGVSRRAPRP